MHKSPNPQTEITPQPSAPSVPWTVFDSWIGVGMLVLLDVLLIFVLVFFPELDITQNVGLVAVQLAYLLPVATVFLWRSTGWKFIGFRKFSPDSLALGCGLLLGGYFIIFVHNITLLALGLETQGDKLMTTFEELDAAGWLLFVGIILAPFVEEIFFRGFLFQGLRQRMGWLNAALLSSLVFSLSHRDPVSLLPTLVLGFIFSYVFQRSNSLWPGMILHFTVNAFGLCLTFAAVQLSHMFP